MNESERPSGRASSRGGRTGRRGNRSPRRLSGGQRLALLAAVGWAVIGLVFFLVNTARLSDRQRLIDEQQAAYDRRVWRTTVQYRDAITRYAGEYGIRPAYMAAIVLNESSYDPHAVSSVGARGLMQLLPDTGSWIAGKLGIKGYTEDSLFDAETNLRLGAWYLDFLSDRYGGDPVLVACAFHAGHGNVDTWLSRYSRDGQTLSLEEIPKENTRTYAKKVVDSYAIYLAHYYPEQNEHAGSAAFAGDVTVQRARGGDEQQLYGRNDLGQNPGVEPAAGA